MILLQEIFRVWMERTAPAGASVSNCNIVTSDASSLEGALRDIWMQICQSSDSEAEPVTVLLLPNCEWVRSWERFSALHKHLQQCRDVCSSFGTAVAMVPLHPFTQAEPTEAGASIADLNDEMAAAEAERRRAPVPAFTFTRRVGPSLMRPPSMDVDTAEPDLTSSSSGDDDGIEYIVSGDLVSGMAARLGGSVGDDDGGATADAGGVENDDDDDDAAPSIDDGALSAAKEALERQFQVDDSGAAEAESKAESTASERLQASAKTSGVKSAEAPPIDDSALEAAIEAAEAKVKAAESGTAKSESVTSADESSSEPIKEVLAQTMSWWEVYFSRVHRVFGKRQRRCVEPAHSAEQVYATFWAEAALLAGDDSNLRICANLQAEVTQPEDAISSLVVLPGLVESEYRAVRQTLALSLPFLGLTEVFSISAFHPRVRRSLSPPPSPPLSLPLSLPRPIASPHGPCARALPRDNRPPPILQMRCE